MLAETTRLVRLALVLSWSACLVIYSVPKEIRPASLHTIRKPIAGTLNGWRLGPAHAVFSGANGDRTRNLWAARIVGTWPDGTERVLERWPDDEDWTTPMGFFDPMDTVWYRMVGMTDHVRLSRAIGTDQEQAKLQAFRKNRGVRQMLTFWCKTAFSKVDGELPVAVAMDGFYSSKSYKLGNVWMRGNRLGQRDCIEHRQTLIEADDIPADPPPWFVAEESQ